MNQKQKDEINNFLDVAKNGGIVAASAAAMRYMEKEHLVYSLNIKCEHIGVHESNRHGMGVDLSHMAELMESIAAIGYVDHGGRICIELDSSQESDHTRRGETNA